MTVRLCVLGRVALDATGRNVPLTRLEATLLAGLALSAESMASHDALAEWLWAEDLPASPKNRLQALVSGLRRKVAPARLIVTTSDGYRLPRTVHCDVTAWQALVQRATTAENADQRRELLHRAGREISADPLRGCAPTPRVDAARRHLQEERLRVVEARLEADLRAGAVAPLVAELTGLVEEHPFHEGFAAQLMTVLARTGRQGDAVSTYGRIRERLDVELGVRPGPLVEAARAAIVRGHPSMSASATPRPSPWVAVGAAPRTVPRSVAAVVGRDEVFAHIEAATTSRVVPAVVALTGVGGIGKTTLAVESAHRLRDRFEGGSLYVDMSGEVGRAGVAAVLDSFLTMLGVRGPDLPKRLTDRAAVFRSILDDRRILVVLDDIPPGYDVSALLPARPGSMAILTSRQPVRGVVATHVFRLGYLDDASALDLLRTYVGAHRLDEAPAGTRTLLSLCGGLPLLLRVVGQRLARRPDLSVDAVACQLAEEFAGRRALTDEDGRLGAGLGVAEGQLPVKARSLLADLARLPFPHVSRQTCIAVCGSGRAADEALDPLVQVGILDPLVRDGADAVYRMHDLIRLHAARSAPDLPPVDLPGIGRRLVTSARRYAASYPDQLLPPPSAASSATEPPAPEESVRYFVTEIEVLLSAVRALSDVDAGAAWELLVLVAPAARRHTDVWLGAEADVRAALGPTGAGRADAYLTLASGVLLLDLPLTPQRLQAMEQALEHFTSTGDHPAAVASAVVLSRAYQLAGDHDAAVAHLMWVSSQLHDDSPVPARAHVAFAWGRLHDAYDVLVPARAAHAESVTLFARTTDWVGLAAAELELAHACRRLGDHATGTTWVHEAAALYERLQDVTGYTACLDAMADLLVQLGQPDEALARADLAVAAAVQHLDSFTQHRAERTRGRALAALHRDGEAEESFRASAAGFEAMGRPFSLAGTLRDLSGLLGRQGRRAEALAVLHRERDVLKRAGARDLSAIERLLHDAALKPALRD